MQFITFHQTIFCFYLVIKAKKFNFAPKNTYNDEEYIIANYQKVGMYLTTPELKRNFNNAVQQIINMQNQNVNQSNFHR